MVVHLFGGRVESWLLFGLLAAFFYGASAIASKVATSEKFFGLNPLHVSLFVLLGVAIVFIAGSLWTGNFSLPKKSSGLLFGVLAGALWAAGMLCTLWALSQGASASRLVPVYNLNTLVAVFLAIILLQELPQATQAVRVIIGAILMVLGAFLVSV